MFFIHDVAYCFELYIISFPSAYTKHFHYMYFIGVFSDKLLCFFFFFFLNDPPPPKFSPFPLHAPLPIFSEYPSSVRSSLPSMVFPPFCCSGGPPLEATCSPAICVQTAVIRRKLMQQERRSMNGTRLNSTSSAFFPPFPTYCCGAAPAMVVSSPFSYCCGRLAGIRILSL